MKGRTEERTASSEGGRRAEEEGEGEGKVEGEGDAI